MRILLLLEGYNSISGVAEVVDNLALQLRRKGHEVAIGSTLDDNAKQSGQERAGIDGIDCTYLDIRSRKAFSWRHLERLIREPLAARTSELSKFIKGWRPDLVNSHVSNWDTHPTIVSACGQAAVPLVQSQHDSGDRGRGKLGERGFRALAEASGFTAVSSATKSFFAKILPEFESARIVPGGVDTDAAMAAPPYYRERPYVFCSARLDLRFKAIDTLLVAFASVVASHPDVDLLIAGGGPDRDQIASLISDCGLGDRVELLGIKTREELRPLYRGALFLAMPSRREEGVPLVYLEALAAGTAVVGTRTGGTTDLIRDGENGLLVNEDDATELGDAIDYLLRWPELRGQMGQCGQSGMLQGPFSWPRFADAYLDVYESSL